MIKPLDITIFVFILFKHRDITWSHAFYGRWSIETIKWVNDMSHWTTGGNRTWVVTRFTDLVSTNLVIIDPG